MYDNVRNGVCLVMTYDRQDRALGGTVENTTRKALRRVRVEVHLSDGTELVPTTPTDLDPGQQEAVALRAPETNFEAWSAHPEVGSGEHGHGEGEHDGSAEHDQDARGEH